MGMQAIMRKMSIIDKIVNGISEYKEKLAIVASADVHGTGMVNVTVLIDGDEFASITNAMVKADKSEAVKAFESAMQTAR